MAFRDDREAQAQRLVELERALADARRDAAELASTKARLDALTAQHDAAVAERDALRMGQGPRLQRLVRSFLAVLVISMGGAAGVIFYQGQGHDAERVECTQLVGRLQAGLDATERERDRARADADEARASAAARPPLPPPRVEPSPPAREARTGTVSAASGRAPVRVGASCAVIVSYEPWASDCRASVTCGSADLYPRGGEGFFGCTLGNGRVTEGADTNPSATSRDPELVLSETRVIVSDEDPAWSVTITLPPAGDPI